MQAAHHCGAAVVPERRTADGDDRIDSAMQCGVTDDDGCSHGEAHRDHMRVAELARPLHSGIDVMDLQMPERARPRRGTVPALIDRDDPPTAREHPSHPLHPGLPPGSGEAVGDDEDHVRRTRSVTGRESHAIRRHERVLDRRDGRHGPGCCLLHVAYPLSVRLLLLTRATEPSTEVLPALGLLAHQVRVLPAEVSALLAAPSGDALLVDGRRDLPQVRSLTRLLRQTGLDMPLLLITTEGGLAAVQADWGQDDVLLDSCGPAELEARLRIAIGRHSAEIDSASASAGLRTGDLLIDESAYTARVRGQVLDLTFKEFELLRFLAQHPGRVFSRAQLLQEVWGYDYFGGTRTIDVHVRRLRAKLGAEHEALIGTVRNVGYRFVVDGPDAATRATLDPRSDAVAADDPDAHRIADADTVHHH